jgi:hypothetical protein
MSCIERGVDPEGSVGGKEGCPGVSETPRISYKDRNCFLLHLFKYGPRRKCFKQKRPVLESHTLYGMCNILQTFNMRVETGLEQYMLLFH